MTDKKEYPVVLEAVKSLDLILNSNNHESNSIKQGIPIINFKPKGNFIFLIFCNRF